MPIFISYSHKDKLFAASLAEQLVRHGVRVWIDEWELSVGDSLIQRVQKAISGSSALIVVLSQSSVKSEWCKKELTSGLLRELEEKRVIVLPAIIEDCDIPLFLRDKLYADFRVDFDEGFKRLFEAVTRFNTTTQGRTDSPAWHTDWSIDWGEMDGMGYVIRLTLIESAIDQPYSCLTEVHISPEPDWSKLYKSSLSAPDGGSAFRYKLLKLLRDYSQENTPITLTLTDSMPRKKRFTVTDKEVGLVLKVEINARWLGQDTGRSVLLDIAGQFATIYTTIEDILRRT